MENFQISRADDVASAIRAGTLSNTAQQGASVRFLAGGTTLIDLMKLDVERPLQLVDIGRLPLDRITRREDGGVDIGATVRNADLAHHAHIQSTYRVLSQALLSGASAQLRNMATTGGNLLQRTRCVYFRDPAMACNKRAPGSGCDAIGGFNRNLAVLGTSNACIASNPSDMNVALTALEARIHIHGAGGKRAIAIDDFFVLPGDTPDRETVLNSGDLITHVSLAAPVAGMRSTYLKLRDRASYEFALASVAAIVAVDDRKMSHVRIALGGVGTKPWRACEAEAVLIGQTPNERLFRQAAEAALADARPQSENGFKVELAKRCIVQALKDATSTA